MLVGLDAVQDKTFDYVIVGGGTAGLVVATRLSEDPETNVLVLEAGGSNIGDPAIDKLASYGSHLLQEKYDWGFMTTPQKNCGDKQYLWSRGKGLGGSSQINFLCWTKPPTQEIDEWESLGNPGWNWKTMQKYFQRVEGYVPPSASSRLNVGTRSEYGRSLTSEGPLKIAYPHTVLDIEEKAQQALMKMGFPAAANPLNGDPDGVFWIPNTIDATTHTRSYSASAYYKPNMHRKNLFVLTNAHANRIISNYNASGGLVATGVEFSILGKDEKNVVNAEKEVILCAGALKSPQILELSGIGERKLLESLDITVKVDLPGVGSNVQDHIFVAASFELDKGDSSETYDLLRNPELAKRHLDLYALNQGIYTMGITGFAFTPLERISPRAEEIHASAKKSISAKISSSSTPAGLKKQLQIQLARLERGAPGCEVVLLPGFALSGHNQPDNGKKYYTIIAALNHLFSRGTIHVTSSDAKQQPAMDPHYFEEDVDLQTLVEVFKFVRKVPDVSPFKEALGPGGKELNPGPNVVTDQQIVDHLKATMGTIFHTAGSASMLPRNMHGVVDPTLKVYGTQNVRVVDMSIVPLHFAAHPQAIVYAIAEYGADLIRGHA